MIIPAHLKTQEEIDAYLYAVACLESNGNISPIPPRRDVFTLPETKPMQRDVNGSDERYWAEPITGDGTQRHSAVAGTVAECLICSPGKADAREKT